jgi:small Trp-rich protein
MYLAAVAVIILILKLAGVDPVAKWSWFYVLIPFVVLAFWWEYLSKWIGWDKRAAEKKMAEAVKENAATKKKNRGF